MTQTPSSETSKELHAIREELDKIDAQIHTLILERTHFITEIERLKNVTQGQSAYRPRREADMMCALEKRHTGRFPIMALEHIWRQMITSFTQLQAPFQVHLSSDDIHLHDLARLQFGMDVSLIKHSCAGDVIKTLNTSHKATADLGIISLESPCKTPWWKHLNPKTIDDIDLKVVARLPFFQSNNNFPDSVVVAPIALEMTHQEDIVFCLQTDDETTIQKIIEVCSGLAERPIQPLAKHTSAKAVGTLFSLPCHPNAAHKTIETLQSIKAVTILGAYARPKRS